MSALLDLVVDTDPSSGATGVPLLSTLSITLDGTDYDEDSLLEGFFVEGPDTDQFVGPGMLSLEYPNNVSQGELDDFFESPGRKGIVAGTVAVTTVSGDTVVTFTPTLPLAASTEYVINLTGVLELDAVTEITGYVTVSFTSGSGSIEEVPASISSSVLFRSVIDSDTPLEVTSTSPSDHSVENDPDLAEIDVVFNKPLDPNGVSASDITVTTVPVTDHPNVSITCAETLVKTVEVSGNTLKIKI